MSLVYYHHPTSQPSRTLLAFMKLSGIEYQEHIVNIFECEHRTDEFAKTVNPLKTVPALIDDGFKLAESEAMMKYLMNSRKVGEAYYPSDLKTRALIDMYLSFHHSAFRPDICKYFLATYLYLKPYCHFSFKKEEVRPPIIATCKKLEEIFLKDSNYIAGDNITIADLLAVNELTQLYYATDFNFDEIPRTKKYIEKCLEHPIIFETNATIRDFPNAVKQIPKAK